MKNPTQWSNNGSKSSGAWTPVTKSASQWANNAVKNATQFTVIGRNSSTWNVNQPSNQTVMYDDANISYNDPAIAYNYRINSNQINQKLQTVWSAN